MKGSSFEYKRGEEKKKQRYRRDLNFKMNDINWIALMNPSLRS
jgi:hypothetical protein